MTVGVAQGWDVSKETAVVMKDLWEIGGSGVAAEGQAEYQRTLALETYV